jgi:hypothetical protein
MEEKGETTSETQSILTLKRGSMIRMPQSRSVFKNSKQRFQRQSKSAKKLAILDFVSLT